MLLISLEINNFRQYKSSQIEFLPGVTAVIGKNGSGKTTVLEAIAWSLYGSSAVRGTNDTLRCRAAEGNSPAEVKLTFSLGAHTYTVIRRLDTGGKSSANLAIDGVPARTGFREVTEAITKLLGMDYQAFFTSFFTAQKELDFMRNMDGRQRASAISRMLGYERLVKARERANQERLGLQREIEGLEKGLGDPEDIRKRRSEAQAAVSTAEKCLKANTAQEDVANKDVEGLKPERDLSEQKAKRADELSRRIELDKAEAKRASDRVTDLRSELEQLSSKQKELESLAPQLEERERAGEEYRRLAELQAHEARRREIAGQLATVNKDEESLSARIAELNAIPRKAEEIDKEMSNLSNQLDEVERRIAKEKESLSAARHRAEAELEQLASRRNELEINRNTIDSAGQSGKCPTCERPLAEELPKVLAGFNDQLSKLDAKVSKLKMTLAELNKEPEVIVGLVKLRDTLLEQRQAKTTEREAAMLQSVELANCGRDLAKRQAENRVLQIELEKLPSGFDQGRFMALRELGEKLKPVRERALVLKAAVERVEGVERDLEREKISLDRVSSEITTAETALKELAFSPEEHERLAKAYKTALTALNASALESERARGDLKAAKASLLVAENDERAYKIKEQDLKEKRRTRVRLQTLAEGFDRLRTDLNNRAAPELAAAASDLLAEMTDGRYTELEVNENYEAMIRDDGELKQIISGGEEDIVNLSLRLAVSRMIADRAGQDMSLLVLDEVFGSLDDIRRENVVALLQALKSRFEQIIIITHVESVHDTVDSCIWVDYDEVSRTSKIRTKSDEEELSLLA